MTLSSMSQVRNPQCPPLLGTLTKHSWVGGLKIIAYNRKYHDDISTEYVSRRGRSRRGVLGGHLGFLTGDIDDKVILDIMDDLVWP